MSWWGVPHVFRLHNLLPILGVLAQLARAFDLQSKDTGAIPVYSTWEFSSLGRASVLHTEGTWFESMNSHNN